MCKCVFLNFFSLFVSMYVSVGFMYVWVSVFLVIIIITLNQWPPETGEPSKCVCFFVRFVLLFLYAYSFLLLMIWHFFTAIKDGCVYTWICLRDKWMQVSVCVREMFRFSPARWRTSFLFLSRYLRSLMKIDEDVTWLHQQQQQIISKLAARTGGDDVMNSTPFNEQWRKEEGGELLEFTVSDSPNSPRLVTVCWLFRYGH